MSFIAIFLFWSMVFIIFFTFIGFPVILWLRSLFFPKKIKSIENYLPNLSIIIAAFNEEEVIIKKLESILANDYPREKMQIIVASDGSTDDTDRLVQNFNAPEVELFSLPRLGKNQAVAQVVEKARSEILVFTDADSILSETTLRNLVAPFADPSIGGVAGDYSYANPQVKQEGVRSYWNYDRLLKRLQTISGSVSAASGALYAIRREIYTEVPPSVTDDFFIAMQVVSKHKRLIFEPKAVAYGPIPSTADEEFRRKVRISTRGLYGVWLHRHLLNPFRYGFFSFQLFMHKLVRRLLVFPIIILFFSALILAPQSWFYQLAALAQIGLHTLALFGFLLRNTPVGQLKILSLPFHLDMVYLSILIAVYKNLNGENFTSWSSNRNSIGNQINNR